MRSSDGSRHRRPALGILIIAASFILGGYLWVQSLSGPQKQKIDYLENLSARLRSETVPVKLMVLSRDDGQIKARLKLYDLAGREVSTIEKSWPGAQLYVDMLLLPFSSESGKAERADSWLALPYRVFTDSLSAASGSLLFDAYDSGGFPEVLGGVQWTLKEKAALKAAYAKARRLASQGLPASDSAKGSYGSAVHEVAKLAGFETGTVYKIVSRVKGGIEVLED
jgi:hypothetical protein